MAVVWVGVEVSGGFDGAGCTEGLILEGVTGGLGSFVDWGVV